jgi:ABC-2 type transport system permease protein
LASSLGFKVDKILVTKLPISSDKGNNSGLAFVAPIKAKLEGIIPGKPNYFEFVAPGIMAMVVMTAVLTGSRHRSLEKGNRGHWMDFNITY